MATAPKIGLAWLVRLRWLAIAGQLAIVGMAVLALRVSLPLPLVASLISITALSNLALTAWLRKSDPSGARAHGRLVARRSDVDRTFAYGWWGIQPVQRVLLGACGAGRLAASTATAWLVAALTSLAFGSLFVLPSHTIDPHAMHMHHGASSLHLQGMWLAYSLAAGFVVHFVSRVASALQAREHELYELQRSAVRHEKLASLSTLAAGAAHELGTPLATIALVAKELERALEAGKSAEVLIPDARLIRQEVERCRDILQQMAARAGEGAGEMLTPCSVRGVEQELSDVLGSRASQLAFEREGELSETRGPQGALGASPGEPGSECFRRPGRSG